MKKLLIPFLLLIGFFNLFGTHRATAQNSWNTAAVFDGSCYHKEMVGVLNSTSGEMTVEFWIKPAAPFSDYAIIGKDQFRIMTNTGKIRVQVGGSSLLYSNATVDTGQWTHVAVTFSNTNNQIKVYLNGSLDNTFSTFAGTLAATSDTLFVGVNAYVDTLQGELDDIRIWKTVRTANEIQKNYKTHLGWYGASYYDNNLIYCQTYDFDVYSPGFYLPHGGSVGTFQSDILGTQPSRTVLHNNSMYFTGSSYLEASSANDPDISLTGPMTVEAWIYPLTIGTTQTILDLTQGAGGYKLTLQNSGRIAWTMGGNFGTSDLVLSPGRWYHIAVVCGTPNSGAQTAHIFINGVMNAGYNYNQLTMNTGKLRIGVNSSGTEYFYGFVDEVRISNFSKTQAEIQRYLHTPVLYNNKPVAPHITVAYNFDGALYSGTRDGSLLQNFGCRFSYSTDTYSPLFHTGNSHESLLDSLMISHPFATIPSTGTAGYTYDTLMVNQSVPIDHSTMKVFVSLNHDLFSDLRIELISPDNDSVVLANQVALPTKGITCLFKEITDQIMNTSFIDNAPVAGTYDDFSIFHGKNSQGNWRLKITDLANGNTGVLNSWGILFNEGYYSVNEQDDNYNPVIFPNPSDGRFYIEMNATEGSSNRLEVYDILGKNVLQEQLTGKISSLNLSGQPKGVYIARIYSGDKSYVQKLIIQ
ncbi:MAG TPA: T9SS type A sorting domain-containing protein [Bacteroidales bacterium]|nr:T9SS type A sorting domain-containing protein [Bacteroidales bacterium]